MFSSQPTGLYGWIKSNEGRSLGLFLAFLLAVQLLAIPTLFFPLAFMDVTHAPFLDWGGYFSRYAPLVIVGSVIWFAWKYWWHIETVKRAVGFHFVDNGDEPYLCSVIEPLITMWGLPVPFVGVIESDARNAFACGVGRKKAVVVVTRGLIDELSRDELSCVLAHELSHIKNGDIKLMAAANIFMSALTEMQRNNPMQMTPVHALMAIAVPAVLPITLLGNLLGAVSLRAGQMSRLLIASKREFIADAEAVQLTQNPGAMASALVKVEHAYVISGMRSVDDSMMIAGDTEGENATHPTVAQRIAALARTTGSMVFNSPHSPSPAAFADNPSLSEAEASALMRKLPATNALPRIRKKSRSNWMAQDQMGMIATIGTVVTLVVLHWGELDQPRTMLAKFDTRPIGIMIGNPIACSTGLMRGSACEIHSGGDAYADFEGQRNTLVGMLAQNARERREAGMANADMTLGNLAYRDDVRAEYAGQSERMKGISADFADQDGTGLRRSDGSFSNQPPEELAIAELEQVGCYQAELFYNNPDGRFPMRQESPLGYTIARHEAQAIGITISRGYPGSDEEADWLRGYIDSRETLLTYSYSNWGLAGLRTINQAFAKPEHAAILERLREKLEEPEFASSFGRLERAKLDTLLARPQDYLPCPALRYMSEN